MKVNVGSGLRSGVLLLVLTVGSAAAAQATGSAKIGSSVVPPKPSPCFNLYKPCRQPVPPGPTPQPRPR